MNFISFIKKINCSERLSPSLFQFKNLAIGILILITALSANSKISGNTCENIVNHLSKRNNLKIIYFIGYKDARPARFVGDRYERKAIVDKVTSNCRSSEVLCGFQRHTKDADLFLKSFGKNKIQLKILHSSITEDDEENRDHSLQSYWSQNIKRSFLKSLSEADIVFYNGHSRSGGGPDFSPPLIRKDLQVDFAKYKSGKDSFKEMLQKFKEQKSTSAVLGLFSCNSTQHFEKDLNSLKKNVLLLTAPELIYYKDALDKSLQSLEFLLSRNCPSLQQLMN